MVATGLRGIVDGHAAPSRRPNPEQAPLPSMAPEGSGCLRGKLTEASLSRRPEALARSNPDDRHIDPW